MSTIEELRRLLGAAPPRPWFHAVRTDLSRTIRTRENWIVEAPQHERGTDSDLALIVAAVNALPKLLDVVEVAQHAVAELNARATMERHPEDWFQRWKAVRDALARLTETV